MGKFATWTVLGAVLPSSVAFSPFSVGHLRHGPVTCNRGEAEIGVSRKEAPLSFLLQKSTRKMSRLYSSKPRLSRPERKALERAKKRSKDQKVVQKVPSLLAEDCSVPDILRRLRRRYPGDDLIFMENRLRSLPTESTNSTVWAQLAIAGLYQKAPQGHSRLVDRCLSTHETYLQSERQNDEAFLDPQQSSAIPLIRALMNNNRTDTAWRLWETLQDAVDVSNAALSTIAAIHFRRLEPQQALQAIRLMRLGTRPVQAERWIILAQTAANCQSQLRAVHMNASPDDASEVLFRSLPVNVVHSVLMARFRTDPSYRYESDPVWYEIVQNALVRRVVFVTGAVSMAGCPPKDRGEACFIGRSNVGKSSLVNLLTNRKSLAFTSKRPGKTQQFNYFAVNDRPGLEKVIKYGDDVPGTADRDHFYIVDIPGFGYAAVPGAIRDSWKDLWASYCAQRPSVIFHLMDGRHGPTADDIEMSQMIARTSSAKYVVVLTKVDKNGKFQVAEPVQRAVRDAIPEGTPVVWTSAERRWGFDVLWKYLQTAIISD